MEDNQFIIFKISDQNYGINIRDVQEIILFKNSVELPNTPDFVEGVINLRGDIVSVISLANRIKRISNQDKEEQKIILTSDQLLKIGYLVDEVVGIISVDNNQISPTPPIVENNKDKYISGVINREDSIIMIIDVRKLLDINEIEVLENFMTE